MAKPHNARSADSMSVLKGLPGDKPAYQVQLRGKWHQEYRPGPDILRPHFASSRSY